MVKRDFFGAIIAVVIGALVLIGLRLFVFIPYQVKSADANSFLAKGDLVVVNQLIKPSRKDFVMYEVDGKTYTGRVVAVAGDNPIYMDDILYLNNVADPEAYLSGLKSAFHASQPNDTVYTDDFTLASITGKAMTEIPADHYLVLNDDRTDVSDSRSFGLIKAGQIKGVLEFKLLPFSEFGFLDKE